MTSTEETRDELLNEKLSDRDIDRARKFLSGCATSTAALRAMRAVMVELEQLTEAAALDSALPAIALSEAASLSDEEAAS